MGGNESRSRVASVSAPPRVRSASSVSLPASLASRKAGNLGQNLKAFLRDSNLSGLEYRLRLAGYYTMEDLLKTNEENLKASGLTPLMTNRLITALAEYHRNKPPRSGAPSRQARPEANAGKRPPQQRLVVHKRNVKRTRSEDQSPYDHGPPVQVKLLSAADTPDAHLIARHNSSDQFDAAAGRRLSIMASKGSSLQRNLSLPEGLCGGVALGDTAALCDLLRRWYSCPVIIGCPPVFTASSSLAEAVSSEDCDEASGALGLLCQMYSQQPRLRSSSGDLEWVVKALQLWYDDILIAERGCRLIKYLARSGDTIPSGAMLAVLDVMCSHPNEVTVQLQSYLAAANIGRTAPPYCKALVFRGGMSAVVSGMEHFRDNSSVQIAGLSLLSVAFAGEPEGRLKFLSEHTRSVDTIVAAMQLYAQDLQVVENSCAFFALLMAGVCHQVECSLVLQMVEQVLQSMNAFSHSEALQVWGCKVIAHMTTSDLLSDSKLAGHCVQAAVGAVRGHRGTPAVQTWGAYALYQIICCSAQNASIITVVHRDSILELCQRRAAGLTEEANLYLSYLETVLET